MLLTYTFFMCNLEHPRHTKSTQGNICQWSHDITNKLTKQKTDPAINIYFMALCIIPSINQCSKIL